MAKKNTDPAATKGMLDEAVGSILGGMDKLMEDVNGRFDIVEGRLGKVEGRLGKVEEGLESVKTEISFQRQDIEDLETEFANTPSRSEFEKLKNKVDSLQN